MELVEDGEFFLKRLPDGEQWLDKYDEMKSLLADTKYLIPKVQLKNAECSTLVEKAEVLIAEQEAFWTL